jgi:crotonobetainyl-CoA:carnitine CoA-transferase CaiB-like acyl-CoA transferase
VSERRTASSLDGVTIVDFSRILAGPLVTMVLGDLGATVIKVERPDGGDDTRSWGPPYDANGDATYFLAINRNKHSVALDLSTPPGRHRAEELIAQADVVVENFRPGVMDRLGLGYDDLRSRHPSLIYCSISAFGTGPGATLPGYDLLVQAVGGLMSITGEPDRPPQKVGVALVDVVAGLYATVGILAALRHKERTGDGQRVEVDLLTSLLAGLSNQSTAYTAAEVVPQRLGNEHPSIAPYEVLQTRDTPIAVAVGNNRQFHALCRALALDDLHDDERFSSNERRVERRAACASSSSAGSPSAQEASGRPS